MRTEEIINEAKGFNKDKMAYLHAEMYDVKRGTAIVAGDESAIVISIYNLIEAFAQTRYLCGGLQGDKDGTQGTPQAVPSDGQKEGVPV